MSVMVDILCVYVCLANIYIPCLYYVENTEESLNFLSRFLHMHCVDFIENVFNNYGVFKICTIVQQEIFVVFMDSAVAAKIRTTKISNNYSTLQVLASYY